MKATGSFPKAAILYKSKEEPEQTSVLDWIRAGFRFPGKPAPNPEPPKPDENGVPFPVPPPPKRKPNPEPGSEHFLTWVLGLPYADACRKRAVVHEADPEMNKLASCKRLKLDYVSESYGVFAAIFTAYNADSSLRIESLYDSSHVAPASANDWPAKPKRRSKSG